MYLCRLEESILEEESLRHLGNLTTMLEDTALFPFDNDIGHEVKEIKEIKYDKHKIEEGAGEEGDFGEKVGSAEDFFNISEMLDDTNSSEENKDDESDRDHEEDENTAFSGPLQTPTTHPGSVANNDERISIEDSSSFPPKQHSTSSTLEKSGTAPLANLRPERYKDANVKDFFPGFKENAPLRFSDLFPVKESMKPSIWKRLKKRKARWEREESREDEASSVEKEKRKRGWEKDYAPIENFVLAECDSVRYQSEITTSKKYLTPSN